MPLLSAEAAMVRRIGALALILALAAILVAAVVVDRRGSEPVETGARLTDLPSVEALQARFNQDGGAVRLILLLSPT